VESGQCEGISCESCEWDRDEYQGMTEGDLVNMLSYLTPAQRALLKVLLEKEA
jgi:hypothetical protein